MLQIQASYGTNSWFGFVSERNHSTEVVLHHNFLCGHFKSAETLYVEGANYPSTVEVNSKGHAMEAVEVRAAITI